MLDQFSLQVFSQTSDYTPPYATLHTCTYICRNSWE